MGWDLPQSRGAASSEIGRFFTRLAQAHKMAPARSPASYAASPTNMRRHTRSQQDSDYGSPRSQSPSQASHRSGAGWDLESYKKSLPTCQDIEIYVKQLEHTYHQEIADLRRDFSSRLEDVEQSMEQVAT